MTNQKGLAHKNYTTLLVLLGIAILLPLLLSTPGAAAGLVLALMVAGWLIVGKEAALQNRSIVMGLAVLVILVNAALAMSALF